MISAWILSPIDGVGLSIIMGSPHAGLMNSAPYQHCVMPCVQATSMCQRVAAMRTRKRI
jgi:hypothetical protein